MSVLMSFAQLLGALSVDWMSPLNHGGAWSKALLAKPNLLVATRSSSGRAVASALTPRLVRVPCVLGRARTILRPEWYLLSIAFQLVDDIIPHVAA